MPTALITGIKGQDGSYLAELLLSKGYRVVGTTRAQTSHQERILQIRDKVEIVEADLLDQHEVERLLRAYEPDEVYNLAARASSRDLWTEPSSAGNINGLTVARMLEAISRVDSDIRFLQASSSEVFGDPSETPQSETTPFHPRNPYGAAKAYGDLMSRVYRENRGLFACCAILYNHESPRRAIESVTRKITRAVASIRLQKESKLVLGRLDARRDWGFAGDYVRALWLMLQQSRPDDYIVATGETRSVAEFCETAFGHVGLDYRAYVIEGAADSRPIEAGLLVGDARKARSTLCWGPSIEFKELVGMMVDADLEILRQCSVSPSHHSYASGDLGAAPRKSDCGEERS